MENMRDTNSMLFEFHEMIAPPINENDIYLQSIIQDVVFSDDVPDKPDDISIYNKVCKKIEINSISDVKKVLDLIEINKKMLAKVI